MRTRAIIQNEAQCAVCNHTIRSAHHYDFQTCKCGAISVDGGMDYIRRVGNTDAIIDRSMTIERDDLQSVVKAVERSLETERNNLGVALAVIRALRDAELLDMEKFQ